MTEAAQTPQSPVSSGRYSLADDGQIFHQSDSTNPLPGGAVGRLVKGPALLEPSCDYAPAAEWLAIHVRQVLEPLFMLKQEAGEGALTAAAQDIGTRLYDALGVLPRTDLEDSIAGLDADLRKALRQKGVRLGPILVFMPALIKPAAVKMRATLWGLWHDKTLPVLRPVDGRVSEVVDADSIDQNFYRMIGYPVYGRRAIRIDMLDRVVTDLYDAADKGVFDAKHKYAEWLGCNLEDLHATLESMGHKKIVEVTPAPVVEDAAPAAADAVVSEAVSDVIAAPAPKPAPLPVKFHLKRGKLQEARAPRHKPKSKKPDPNVPQLLTEEDKARIAARETARKTQKDERAAKPKPPTKKPREHDKGRNDKGEGRVYSFEAKNTGDDGNPFAILKNLKK